MCLIGKAAGMFEVTLFGAAFAGILSFVSPCVLPIVPFYISYLAGVGLGDLKEGTEISKNVQRRAILSSLFFASGMVTIFVGMGATASAFGHLVREWFGVLRWFAAVLIILMGLHFLGLLKISVLNKQFKMEVGSTKNVNYPMAFLLGAAFAFGWTPCVGPILAAILFTAAASDSILQGMLLLVAYGVGMTSPFVLASIYVRPFLRWIGKFKQYLGAVERVNGLILLIFGVLIATNSVNVIANWMLRLAPEFWTYG